MRTTPLVHLGIFCLLCGCSGTSDSQQAPNTNDASTGDASVGNDSSQNPDSSKPATGLFAECGGAIFDSTTGKIDSKEYQRQARLWDKATIDCRLGPKFAELNPGTTETRPTAYEPEHKKASGGYLCPTYELSGSCSGNCDYGSTAGQVLYAPTDATGTGVDRIQNYAYEKGVICESIQSGGWLGGPHPDPGLTTWTSALGHAVRLPNGFSQTEYTETNAGIMIFPDGLVGATGNQTSGDSKPYFQLPANKVPTSVAVTTANEFALVTIWDTEALKGQVAVFALRADKPEAFSVPYFGLFNEAGFQNIHLMGYLDLPDMQSPTAIAVSGDNGNTPGGHVPGFEFGNQGDPTKNIITSQTARDAFSREDYERRVPMTYQAVIASRWENKVIFLDLRPLAQFVRGVYFGTDDSKRQAAAAKTAWPFTFDNSPEAKPVIVTTVSVQHPTVLRVNNQGNSNEQDLRKPLKAWVGNLAGEVRIYDISSFAHDATRPVPAASVKELAVVQAGRNLTSMTRQGSNYVLVASRGDARVDWVGIDATDKKALKVTRTLRDSRFSDPVVADSSDRGPVVTIGDFTGKQLLNFRVGRTEANGGKPPSDYGCGAGGADKDCTTFEFGGKFDVLGSPFFVGTTNVN